jgi:hypothetical protein
MTKRHRETKTGRFDALSMLIDTGGAESTWNTRHLVRS